MADPDATLGFTYDTLGRRLTESTGGGVSGQPAVTLTSAYDQVGNRTRLADNVAGNVGVTTYAYDALDRLTTITRSLGGAAGPRVTLAYDAADRLTTMSRTLSDGTGTAVTSTVTYDALDRLTTLGATNGDIPGPQTWATNGDIPGSSGKLGSIGMG